MKENEFVKRHGWLRAKQILKYAEHEHTHFIADGMSCTYTNIDVDGFYSLSCLYKLVDARRIVDLYGGLMFAKEYLNNPSTKQDRNTMYLFDSIALVESCQ